MLLVTVSLCLVGCKLKTLIVNPRLVHAFQPLGVSVHHLEFSIGGIVYNGVPCDQTLAP